MVRDHGCCGVERTRRAHRDCIEYCMRKARRMGRVPVCGGGFGAAGSEHQRGDMEDEEEEMDLDQVFSAVIH